MWFRIPFHFLVSILFLFPPGIPSSWSEEAPVRCETVKFNQTGYDTVWIETEKTTQQHHWKSEEGKRYQTFHQLKMSLEQSGKRLLFATNSGIYAEDNTPLGLHIEQGQILIKLTKSKAWNGNFSMKPNADFLLER